MFLFLDSSILYSLSTSTIRLSLVCWAENKVRRVEVADLEDADGAEGSILLIFQETMFQGTMFIVE